MVQLQCRAAILVERSVLHSPTNQPEGSQELCAGLLAVAEEASVAGYTRGGRGNADSVVITGRKESGRRVLGTKRGREDVDGGGAEGGGALGGGAEGGGAEGGGVDGGGVNGGSAEGVELSQLLALHRLADGSLETCMRRLVASQAGNLLWRDFVNTQLAHQLAALLEPPSLSEPPSLPALPRPDHLSVVALEAQHSDCGGGGGDGGEVRRELAVLLSTLARWSWLPAVGGISRLLSATPALGAHSASHANMLLQMEAAVRTYMYAGRPAASPPDVWLFGSILFNCLLVGESAALRAAATDAIREYQSWIPASALEEGCRSALQSSSSLAGEGGGGTGCCGVVSVLSLVLELPRTQAGCAPVDWSRVFDACVCQRLGEQLSCAVEMPSNGAAAGAEGAVEWALKRLPRLCSSAEGVALRERLCGLLQRPATSPQQAQQQARLLEVVRSRSGLAVLTDPADPMGSATHSAASKRELAASPPKDGAAADDHLQLSAPAVAIEELSSTLDGRNLTLFEPVCGQWAPSDATRTNSDDRRARMRDWNILRAFKEGLSPESVLSRLRHDGSIPSHECWSEEALVQHHATICNWVRAVLCLVGPEASPQTLLELRDLCS